LLAPFALFKKGAGVYPKNQSDYDLGRNSERDFHCFGTFPRAPDWEGRELFLRLRMLIVGILHYRQDVTYWARFGKKGAKEDELYGINHSTIIALKNLLSYSSYLNFSVSFPLSSRIMTHPQMKKNTLI